MFKNTRQQAGDVVEINSNLKLAFNQRPVKVKVSKEDRDLLDAVSEMYHDEFVYFQTPNVPLLVEVISDTFREGLVGKFVNIQAWHDARQKEYSAAWIKYQRRNDDTWDAI